MKKTIQIVEDDSDIRFILEYLLTDSGYHIQTFDCIKAFNQRQRKQDIDLVMLDVRLPDGSGIDLCKNLKQDSSMAHVPIMVMSAHASGCSALDLGKADYFLAKPFDLDALVHKIAAVTTTKSFQA